MEAAARRSEASILKLICFLGLFALGAIDLLAGTRGVLTTIMALVTLGIRFHYGRKVQNFRCPRCDARVNYQGKYIRCGTCQLLIYPVE